MSKNGRKIVAPVIIAFCVIVYYIIVVFVFICIDGIPLFVKIPGILIPVAFIGVSVFVLRERINEVRSGEEDDLGKY